nr:hypothetical protein [Tanacetum cinerariifolium]
MTPIVAILHNVNRVLSEYHNDGSLAMLTVDFSNAFNLGDRSELLDEETHIWSAIGVQQGDTHKIKDSCKLLFHAWPSAGVKLLGGAVSRDTNFISGLDMRRAVNVVDLMSLLPHFGDDAVEDFEEYTLRDYYCCWYKLKLLDNVDDSRLRLLEKSALVDDKMKK